MAYVYRHIRLDTNQPFYIGIGSDESYKRAYYKFNRNYLWNNIVKKTDYCVEIIFENENYEIIKQKEVEFIELYGRKDLNTGTLVNLTGGGQGRLCSTFSEEEKEKRKKRKGHMHPCFGKKLTEEHKEKIRLKLKGIKKPYLSEIQKGKKRDPEKILRGKDSPSYGRVFSEESKQKLSNSLKKFYSENESKRKGKPNPSLSKYNLSFKKEERYWFGRKLTDEHKENLRKSNIGKKRSKETCENNRNAQILRFKTKKHPRCKIVLNTENGIFYDSAKEASIVFGYKKPTLIGMLNGSAKNKTSLIYV